MASLQQTYSGDLSTSIASVLWQTRNIASAAKREALDVAKAYGVNPMFRTGEFMSRALQMQATSGLPKSLQRQMPLVTMGNPSYLARGQGSSDPLMGTPAHLRNLPEYQQFASSSERNFKGSNTVPNIPKVPRVPTTTNNTNTKGTSVKDQQLGNFLAAVALSLSSSFNSINKKLDEANEGIIVAKDGIDSTHKKLEYHSDSIESKLDDIIDALRFSNTEEKVQRDQREFNSKQKEEEKATDLSNANRVIMQDMDRQEIRDMQAKDLAEDDRGPINDMSLGSEEQLNLPSLAKGGIVSGPDSGYLAVLHGDEAVVPLDNNYTQNQPSAVGKESVANMPMLPRAEMGIDNSSTMKPTFRNNINVSTPRMSKSGGDGTDLAKAIELPSKMAGIVTMGIMGDVLKSSVLPTGIISHIKSLSAPITEAFGVPNSIISDLTEGTEQAFSQNQKRQDVLAGGLGKKGREKGILGKIKQFLFGTGGGDISYRAGSGGSSTVYNRTGGGTGGGNIAWGKKKKKEINSKADFGAIKRRTATTDAYMVEAGMLDPSSFESKYGISADKWLRLPDYPTNQSSLDSPVFTKNVSYENAFDYKKFDSPQYGLKTSEIAYNMSMDDEVNSTIDSLSDKDQQMILNTQTANTKTGNQMEQSAIATRGNPLKEGTYLSPYSV
tara:strand:- start:140 stop:2137 length:1998 start_codon:yes stop_codon:yes gene_type:complete